MIGIVCALKCEAEPLIRRFSLSTPSIKTAYPIYQSNDIALIISGIGKIQAASATAYLYGLLGCRAFLNIGVGGHRFHPIGEGFLAHQVRDFDGGRSFYPAFGWKLKEKTASFITVDRVERCFEEEGIYEMEAAGFCTAAFRFSSAELIHSYKIISDNCQEAPSYNPAFVRTLVGECLEEIDAIVKKLHLLIKDLSDVVEGFDLFLEKWHFTTTQNHQLKRLLQRWKACFPSKNIWETEIMTCRSSREVIQFLDRCFS